MRYLIIPLIIFAISWLTLWNWRSWNHVSTWRKLATIFLCSVGAGAVSLLVFFFIVVVFN